MTQISRISRCLAAFKRDEGSVSAEAVLMTPLLIWAWIAMYSYFEALREHNINLKAAYTIGDLLSREDDEINMTYLEGMNEVYRWLTRTNDDVRMRVSVVRFDNNDTPALTTDDTHELIWSRGVKGPEDLVQADIGTYVKNHVPIMADDDTAIVVETWADFRPILDIVMEETDVYNIVVTKPRFNGQLRYEGVNTGGGDTHNDGTDTTGSI